MELWTWNCEKCFWCNAKKKIIIIHPLTTSVKLLVLGSERECASACAAMVCDSARLAWSTGCVFSLRGRICCHPRRLDPQSKLLHCDGVSLADWHDSQPSRHPPLWLVFLLLVSSPADQQHLMSVGWRERTTSPGLSSYCRALSPAAASQLHFYRPDRGDKSEWSNPAVSSWTAL